jgi:hypothetical protein
LIKLYSSVGADPNQPQDVSRRLNLNRNLTWKLSRVINAPDAFSVLNHLPGQQGLDLALKAFEKAGASRELSEGVRISMQSFVETVAALAGDRERFELTLQSMGLFEPEHRVDHGRELAFRGNSMIWGVQARARVCCMVIAPGQAPDTVDIVQIGGLIGFQRLRPSASWRLFRMQMWSDAGEDMLEKRGPDAVMPGALPHAPLVLSEFCSENMPEIEARKGPDGTEFILPGGPVGSRAAFDCYYGYVARGLPMYRDESNAFGATAVPNTLPAEHVIVDILLHQGVPRAGGFEALVYGYPHGGTDGPTVQTISNQLPIRCDPVELAGPPPAVATSLAPGYDRVVSRVIERMGWDSSAFMGVRSSLEYPPMSSRVVLRFPLLHAPGV